MRTVFIYLAVISASLGLSYFLFLLTPVNSAGDTMNKNFLIESGTSFSEIVRLLKEAEFIRSEAAFKTYSLLSGSARNLKAGDYVLNSSLSTPEIIALLVSGPEIDIKITIIEGERLKEIDEKLSAQAIINKGELVDFKWRDLTGEFPFLKGVKLLEGFLFPDTYRFFPKSSVEDVVRKFLTNFQKKALPILGKDFYKNLIIASLIEREVPFYEDRLLVSGILHKRLEIDMPLQVDAAPETYKYYGLPAAPIANPGIEAIQAAINPRKSDYLYYLSDPKTKRTIFSETFEEHDENRSLYLKK